MPIQILFAAVLGYFLGAIPCGYLVARAHGVEILKVGSGNPGATNVNRVIGRGAGAIVFLLDFLKGAIAAGWPLMSAMDAEAVELAQVAGVSGAILGHGFSAFLKGRGGKGVATAMGGLLALMPIVVSIGIAIWLVAFYSTRYVSIASILFAASLPFSNLLLDNSPALIVVSLALAAFMIFRHRANIQRLLNGTEHRFVRGPKNGAHQ